MKNTGLCYCMFLSILGISCLRISDIPLPDTQAKIVVNALFNLDSTWKVNVAFAGNTASDENYFLPYIHLLSSTGVGLPADLWVPATERTSPPESSQSVLGFTWAARAGLEISLEAYYKDLKRVIEYKDGTSYFGNFTNWEDRITAGVGKSYGVELFIHKPVGRLNGWLSYTLAKSTRQYRYSCHGRM